MKSKDSSGVEKNMDAGHSDGKQLKLKAKTENKFTLIEVLVIASIIVAIAAVSAPLVIT